MHEKNPSLRYQHAKDAQIDLQRIIRDRHPQEVPPGSDPAPATGGLRLAAASLSRTKVLVMDFRHLTSDGEQNGLGASLTETVTADINTALGFEVVGREAVSELRRLGAPAAPGNPASEDTQALEWARRAGAGWLITGAYQRFDDRIRITAKLIDTQEGTIVRTAKIDGDARQILALQDRIVPELTKGLNRSEPDVPEAQEELPTVGASEDAVTVGSEEE
jgi:TolB-like protein